MASAPPSPSPSPSPRVVHTRVRCKTRGPHARRYTEVYTRRAAYGYNVIYYARARVSADAAAAAAAQIGFEIIVTGCTYVYGRRPAGTGKRKSFCVSLVAYAYNGDGPLPNDHSVRTRLVLGGAYTKFGFGFQSVGRKTDTRALSGDGHYRSRLSFFADFERDPRDGGTDAYRVDAT